MVASTQILERRIDDRSLVTPWIKIIRGRPNLGDVVPAIIRAAEDGAPLARLCQIDDRISSAFVPEYEMSAR